MEITAKKEDEGKLIETLQSADAPEFDKDVACRQLAVIGTGKCVPALAALLENDHLYDVARHALVQIPDPAAGEALRAAMKKAEGTRRVAIINSIGNRRDRDAVADLIQTLRDPDPAVAAEAADALAKIGGREAGGALTDALGTAPEAARSAVADACLKMADSLMARDRHDIAVRLFDNVRQANVRKYIRAAAARGAILARRGEGLPLLIELLKGEDFALFEMGLWVAREMPGDDVAGKLEAVVNDLPAERQGLLRKALRDRGKL